MGNVYCREWDRGGFNHYLPFTVSDADIDSAIDALRTKDLVTPADAAVPNGSATFTFLPAAPSDIHTAGAHTRYAPLVDVCDTLRGLRLADRPGPSCTFVQTPDNYRAADAETQGADFVVDAFLKLRGSTVPAGAQLAPDKAHVVDLAVPFEYKMRRDEALQNRKQLLGTAAFCMNDDPRRMYMYGVTIEDGTVAVWYFSRSHSAKSPDFNFATDCRTYIRVMLSLMFATEEELGYDPTVQRRIDPATEKLCFIYQVGDKYFKTKQTIFDHRSLCTTGRATRVWAATEVASFDEPRPLDDSNTVVLKDVWLDHGAKTEGDNLKAIFLKLESIRAALPGDEPAGFAGMDAESQKMLRDCLEKRNWQKYFLTARYESRGVISKKVASAAQPDDTLLTALPATVTRSSVSATMSSRSMISPAAVVPVAAVQQYRRYHPKQQYRVVFEEVCVALHDVPRLKDAMTALLDCVFALQLLFLAGWVHRDISSGNVYWFIDTDGSERGILADLEYAKPFEPETAKGSSDPKTGTAYFMAVEIQRQTLIYNTLENPRRPPVVLPGTSSSTFESDKDSVDALQSKASVGVFYNFEHDMESVYWLLLWTVLWRFPRQNSVEDQKVFAGKMSAVFQDTSTCSPEREWVLTQKEYRRSFLSRCLAPELLSILGSLQYLGAVLHDGYLSRKFNFDNLSSYASLYSELRFVLQNCQQFASTSFPDLLSCHPIREPSTGGGTTAPTVTRPFQVVRAKRGRSQSNADDINDEEYNSKAARVQGSVDVGSRELRPKRSPIAPYNEQSD